MVTNLKIEFGKKYRVFMENTPDESEEARIWRQELRGRNGVVYPYGYTGDLACFVTGSGIAGKLRRISGVHPLLTCKNEYTFKFNPSLFPEVAKLLKLKKRRHLSPEARQKATERLGLLRLNRANPSPEAI